MSRVDFTLLAEAIRAKVVMLTLITIGHHTVLVLLVTMLAFLHVRRLILHNTNITVHLYPSLVIVVSKWANLDNFSTYYLVEEDCQGVTIINTATSPTFFA